MRIIHLILLFLLISCGTKESSQSNNKKISPESYEQLKMNIQNHRKGFYSKTFDFKKIKAYIFYSLKDSIFPAWQGTKWDFNGTSTIPQKGNIACGYFVMTTLEHAGFKCNRVKFAQQASSKIVISFSKKEDVKVFGNNDFTAFYAYVSKFKDELFIVGLDNHVGFVVNDSGKLFAIHSTAWPQGEVVIEPLIRSQVFKDSKVHYTGKPLNSETILKKWRLGEEIKMI